MNIDLSKGAKVGVKSRFKTMYPGDRMKDIDRIVDPILNNTVSGVLIPVRCDPKRLKEGFAYTLGVMVATNRIMALGPIQATLAKALADMSTPAVTDMPKDEIITLFEGLCKVVLDHCNKDYDTCNDNINILTSVMEQFLQEKSNF